MKDFNLTIQRTQITEDDLDQVTLLYVKAFPNVGQKSYCAFLLNQGIYISCQKAQNNLLCVDLEGVIQRFRKAIKCRRYHVTTRVYQCVAPLRDTINLLDRELSYVVQ